MQMRLAETADPAALVEAQDMTELKSSLKVETAETAETAE
jgi:hypothetical protein